MAAMNSRAVREMSFFGCNYNLSDSSLFDTNRLILAKHTSSYVNYSVLFQKVLFHTDPQLFIGTRYAKDNGYEREMADGR